MIWDLIEYSSFDKHFNDAQLSIDTLLLDENIITEFKNLNPKLLQFLETHKRAFLDKLIEYTTVMPLAECGYDRCYKLPYISSYLLAIDCALISSYFFGTNCEELWDKLLALLKGPAHYNYVLLGYFYKVLNNLHHVNKKQTTVCIFKQINLFLSGIINISIGNIIQQSIMLFETEYGAVLNERLYIVKLLIDRFVYGEYTIKQASASILTKVVGKFQTFSSGDAILTMIWNSEYLLSVYNFESQAVSMWVIGILTKGMEIIIAENDKEELVLIIPEKHRKRIGKYIFNLASRVMTSNYTIDKSWKNQCHSVVLKVPNEVMSLITMLALAVDNGIDVFVTENLLEYLWLTAAKHPFNDILLVKITNFFITLSSRKNGQFVEGYYKHILELAGMNIKLLRPHLFVLWKKCGQHMSAPMNSPLRYQWEYFEYTVMKPLLKYEPSQNKKKNMSIVSKLVVDEVYTAAPSSFSPYSVSYQTNINSQKPYIFDLFSFTSYKIPEFNITYSNNNVKPKQYIIPTTPVSPSDPFAAFKSFW